MPRYWTSADTGRTYDVTERDRHGNFRQVGALEAAGYGDSSLALAMAGGGLLIGSAAIGTIVLVGAMTLVAFLTVLALARWPLAGLVLLVLTIAMLLLPAGRRRWKMLVVCMVLSVLHMPMSIVSYSLLRDSQVYGYLASLPLVPVAAAVILVLALIKRFWVSAAVAGSMAMISCLPYLMAWGFATTTFDGRRLTMAASDYGYDNILSLLCCFILAVCWTVVISQWAQFQRHRAQPAYQV